MKTNLSLYGWVGEEGIVISSQEPPKGVRALISRCVCEEGLEKGLEETLLEDMEKSLRDRISKW